MTCKMVKKNNKEKNTDTTFYLFFKSFQIHLTKALVKKVRLIWGEKIDKILFKRKTNELPSENIYHTVHLIYTLE